MLYRLVLLELVLPALTSASRFEQKLPKLQRQTLSHIPPVSHGTRSHYLLKNVVLVQDIVIHTIAQPALSLLTEHITSVLQHDYIFRQSETEFGPMGVLALSVLGYFTCVTQSRVYNLSKG